MMETNGAETNTELEEFISFDDEDQLHEDISMKENMNNDVISVNNDTSNVNDVTTNNDVIIENAEPTDDGRTDASKLEVSTH